MNISFLNKSKNRVLQYLVNEEIIKRDNPLIKFINLILTG